MLRRSRPALSLSLLIAACGSAPKSTDSSFSAARGFDPLQACVTTTFGRYARGARCRDTELLFVSRPQSPAGLLDVQRAFYTAYGIPVDERSLLMGGADTPALGYSMGPFESATISSLLVALPQQGSDESIEAQCYRRGGPVDPKRCSVLLDGFVKQGVTRGDWPSALVARDPQTPLEFDLLGTTVRLPAGCDELAPLDVACRDGHVRLLVGETQQGLPRMLAADLQALAQSKLERQWQSPCSVDGVATTCTLSKQQISFDTVYTMRAAVMLRDRPLLISCETKRTRAPQLPGPICSQFFTIAPAEFADPPPPEE